MTPAFAKWLRRGKPDSAEGLQQGKPDSAQGLRQGKPDFDHVRESFAASRPGRIASSIARVVESAWQSSWLRAIGLRMFDVRPESANARVRSFAIAVAVAAALQPLLIATMPAAIKPAMPTVVFIAIALLATLAAWRPDAVDAAWRRSQLTRWIRD